VSFSAPLGFYAGGKVRGLAVSKHRKIIAVGEPLALLTLLDPKHREQRKLQMRIVGQLPLWRMPPIVGEEGWDSIVERVNDNGSESL
jgi:hypothetical protein